MANRSPTIIDRADEVDTDLVPEPWDDRDAAEDQEIVTRRERYRLQGVTDGQGAGIVPAYALNVADTGSIPSKTQDGWTRGSAGRVLGPDGKYVSRGSDVPRKSFDREEPGLLVEAASRTNHQEFSSGHSQWSADAAISRTAKSSVVEGETAQEIINGGGTADSIQQDSGTFSSSNQEVVWALLEEGTSQDFKVRVRDKTDFQAVGGFSYSFIDDSINAAGTSNTIKLSKRTITNTGPNGGRVVLCIARYDPTDIGGSDDDFSGRTRETQILPDNTGNGNAGIVHHTQVEQAPNASSPIVTQGSPTTRSADDYAISVGDWVNENESTWIIEATNTVAAKTSFNASVIDFGGAKVEFQRNSAPYDIRVSDGSSEISVGSSIGFFETKKFAFSATQDSFTLSADGTSESKTHNGNLMAKSGDSLGFFLNTQFRKILYVPRALPESTLNAITS